MCLWFRGCPVKLHIELLVSARHQKTCVLLCARRVALLLVAAAAIGGVRRNFQHYMQRERSKITSWGQWEHQKKTISGAPLLRNCLYQSLYYILYQLSFSTNRSKNTLYKNVSCEYDRVNGWNSTLQAAWYIRRVRIISTIWFLWTKPTIWLSILSLTQNIVRACSVLSLWRI